jgi:hypothetical protein
MVEAGENMNHRMWNLYVNEAKQWLKIEGGYQDLTAYYYFKSTVYRFLAVCATARRFEAEALLLDSRIAEKSDLDFVKYVKALLWAMSDVALFQGLPYDDFDQVDHFFRDHLRRICDSYWKNENFVTLSDFETAVERDNALQPVLDFFNGLRAEEPRFRWDRLLAFHLLLLAFLNTFGYKSQKSTDEQFLNVAQKFRNRQVLTNLSTALLKLGLANQEGAKRISIAQRRLTR